MEAQKKLEEAKYFLGKMEECKDEKEFRYLFSAFLNSARSVTWFLQKELAHHESFDEWYRKKQEEFAKDPIIQFFKKKRNISTKEKIVTSEGRYYKWYITERKPSGEEKVVAADQDFEPEKLYFWYNTEDTKEGKAAIFTDIMTLSEEYIEKLTRLLKDAEELFTS